MDREPRMISLARQRLGRRTRVEVAGLEQPLSIVADSGIDIVVAPLVVHYLADWRPVLSRAARRCLAPDGILVFSVSTRSPVGSHS